MKARCAREGCERAPNVRGYCNPHYNWARRNGKLGAYKGSASAGLEEIKRETRPGRCIACEELLPRDRRVLCGDPECTRTYWLIHRADTADRRPAA